MKLSEILNQARKGGLIASVKVLESEAYRKKYPDVKGETSYAPTLFQKKHVNKQEGDEVVPSLNGTKETNISEMKRVLTYQAGQTMEIMVGGKFFRGVIEIDV